MDNSTNGVSGIEPQYNMEQVGDYVWQAVIHITNEVDIGVAVIGSNRYVSGSADYDSNIHTWLDEDQDPSANNPPMFGEAVDNYPGASRIRISINYDGFMMFRFCTTNGNYEVRRAAWQDFNSWQAPNTEYTRSFGLFETTAFESSLDDVDPTIMESAGLPDFKDIANVPIRCSLPTIWEVLLSIRPS